MDSVDAVLSRMFPETTKGPVTMDSLATKSDELRAALEPFGEVSIDLVLHRDVVLLTVYTMSSGQVTRSSRVEA